MSVLGPRGWSCEGTFGADGGGGVTIFPQGSNSSSPEAIAASQTSACVGCAIDQACPLFTVAWRADVRMFHQGCSSYKPSFEIVRSIGTGIVHFEDPPGIKGDGVPSGGRYRAIGVMTYYPDSPNGSWLETCTLRSSDRAICLTSVRQFVAQYGTY
jgi:hypothetical protein